MTASKTAAKKQPSIASLQKRIKQLETELAAALGNSVAAVATKGALGNTRYNVAGIKKDGLSYTPDAVDAIRIFTWAQSAKGVEKKAIVAALIDQGFNKATVRARVKRIFDGTEESCYSEAIRARLGLDDLDEEDGEEE